MKQRRYALYILSGILVLIFALPYAKVEILSINAEHKLEAFDVSCFDDVYCEGTPEVYDCKIYTYSKEHHAKALYVFGDCEFGVMVDLEWNPTKRSWELVDGRNMWSAHRGSAQEFYWPLYYGGKLLPWLDN
jgi:hypothetical protein